MNSDDIDIGEKTAAGQRISMDQENMDIVIDAVSGFDIVMMATGQEAGFDLVTAGNGSPFTIERTDESMAVAIHLPRLDQSKRYTLGAYASSADMPNILVTIDKPRCHFAIESKGPGAVALVEIYNHQGVWKMKMDGGWYSGGLTAMLSA